MIEPLSTKETNSKVDENQQIARLAVALTDAHGVAILRYIRDAGEDQRFEVTVTDLKGLMQLTAEEVLRHLNQLQEVGVLSIEVRDDVKVLRINSALMKEFQSLLEFT